MRSKFVFLITNVIAVAALLTVVVPAAVANIGPGSRDMPPPPNNPGGDRPGGGLPPGGDRPGGDDPGNGDDSGGDDSGGDDSGDDDSGGNGEGPKGGNGQGGGTSGEDIKELLDLLLDKHKDKPIPPKLLDDLGIPDPDDPDNANDSIEHVYWMLTWGPYITFVRRVKDGDILEPPPVDPPPEEPPPEEPAPEEPAPEVKKKKTKKKSDVEKVIEILIPPKLWM